MKSRLWATSALDARAGVVLCCNYWVFEKSSGYKCEAQAKISEPERVKLNEPCAVSEAAQHTGQKSASSRVSLRASISVNNSVYCGAVLIPALYCNWLHPLVARLHLMPSLAVRGM